MSSWPEYLRILLETPRGNVRDLLKNSTIEAHKLTVSGGVLLATEITQATTEKDPDIALDKWKETLKDAKALRSKAQEIPPDSLADHAWRAVVSPWWSTVIKYSKAGMIDKDVSNINKDDTINKFNMMISFIESQIDRLEKTNKH